jgi:hypothetical protein
MNESTIFHEIYSIAIATRITVYSRDSHFLVTKGEIEFAAVLRTNASSLYLDF